MKGRHPVLKMYQSELKLFDKKYFMTKVKIKIIIVHISKLKLQFNSSHKK